MGTEAQAKPQPTEDQKRLAYYRSIPREVAQPILLDLIAEARSADDPVVRCGRLEMVAYLYESIYQREEA